jgi:hypothetical protein
MWIGEGEKWEMTWTKFGFDTVRWSSPPKPNQPKSWCKMWNSLSILRWRVRSGIDLPFRTFFDTSLEWNGAVSCHDKTGTEWHLHPEMIGLPRQDLTPIMVSIYNLQQRMSRFPHRWRTQRNAIRNANCKTSWII